MPVHDWTRVNAGIFHHFHQRWIAALCDDLNRGDLLPNGFFALAEQVAGGPIPDVLALERWPRSKGNPNGSERIAIATPPRTRFTRQAESDPYVAKANQIAIHHPLGQVVALVEIVSPGNKESRNALRALVEKSAEFIRQGIHLLIIDLFPPTPRDPQGIHKAIWDEIHEEDFELPADKPLTLVAYAASPVKTAYIEPVAVGDVLPDMPVFLEPGKHILAPLECTYMTTWSVCPEPMRELVAAGGA